MLNSYGWLWAAAALILFVAEIFTVGFFLICFAIGAAAAAGLAFAGFNFTWQVLAFLIGSVLALLVIRPFATRVTRSGGPNRVGIDRVLGKEAMVIEAIVPDQARGRVRVEREEWLADAADGALIAAGTRVVVLSVDGTRLKVRPA